jgi:titin
MPNRAKWIRKGGRVITHVDGSTTYIKKGISVRYTPKGFPDFRPFLYKGNDGLSEVSITLTGNRTNDEILANRAAGFAETPFGYTWHHHENIGLMQLVNDSVHSKFWHSGGFSLRKKLNADY